MTQDEVDLIYDYLHENYEYVQDGNLVHRNDLLNKTKKKGDSLGCFQWNTRTPPYLMASVNINNKRYRMKLIKFIFIYHHKYLPFYLTQKNKNPMDTRIENLEASEKKELIVKKFKEVSPVKFEYKDGTFGYIVRLASYNKNIYIGTYNNEKTANEVYALAKQLLLDKKLDKKQIIALVREKYLLRRSTTGVLGVYKKSNRFIAQIKINKKKIHLGSFKTKEEAHQAYLKAKEELGK